MSRLRYRITYRKTSDDGVHFSATKVAGTLWGAVQEINSILEDGGVVENVERETWSREPLTKQERDTIEMLTRGKVKF